ncbi:membrane protein [Streptomyces cirratus]|uniref:Endolytic murein transglycosylase n=1 Tax=Streptomyces cirratus TaxID=68187 RepID=A0ABQ3F1P5_9ACTN|nr:endolytic transglycosylase MltG [Streptomyces cirratus]GHB62439.1 membrane protein [Streptomyces cirratus]
MTEYGRGRAPEPWHPEDPLYGDQGYDGHPAQQGQMPYAGDPQQQYAQAPQHQAPQFQTPQFADGHFQDGQQYQQHPDQLQQQYQQYPQEGFLPQQQYQQNDQPQPAYGGQPWDTGQGQYAGAPADPYADAEPYAQQTAAGFPGEAPDLYATPEAYPPPVPPSRRHLEPEPDSQDADLLTEDPEEEPESPAGDDDGRGGGGRRGGRSKKPKAKPRRRGVSCLVAAVVVAAVLGGGGYYGYTYIKARYGPGEDYAGPGLEETVDVEIPKNATLAQMGSILEKAGVVASAKAFVTAADTPKGKGIQPGTYPLKKKMSAAAAVALMTDPSKLNVIIVPEGKRNVDVYAMIDNKLGKPQGTTQDIAKREAKNLGLPAWAASNPKIMDPLEGFLYPTRYDLTKDMAPEALLKQMVKNASDKYAALGLEAKAKDLGLENPLQVVTVASLVNAEGMNHDDFRKMSDVIYNRLKKTNDVTNQKLEFDSTINYLKGTSNINVSRAETKTLDHPYNTYFYKGLPPGPIGNPGTDALNASLNPDRGGWMFFVSVDGQKTTFTKTFAEHEKLVAEFNERQKQKNGG